MHLEKLPSGRWRAVVQHQGRRRSVTARTRGEAQHAAAQILLELGAKPKLSGLTIGALVAGYIADRTPVWSPKTLDDRKAAVKKISAVFADLPAEEVTVPMVLGLWRDLARRGETPHRVHRVGQILGSAFQSAIRAGLIPGPNPFHDSPAPRPERSEIEVPGDAQVRALLEGDALLGLFLRMAATTGARRGELCGLQWADIDFERATVKIMRSIVQVPGEPLHERKTKTGVKGQRVVTLDVRTAQRLAGWKADQVPAVELGLPDPVWVFSDDHGLTPWKPNAITNRVEHYRKKHNAGHVTIQGLRHYVATTMLQDGESAIDVANQLGHASTSTTLNVYAHFVPGRNRDAIDRLAARLDS